ncbi:BQ5605_C007g04569 [Microbotryum silenes-dioicae]|uniref:BQ5605_C007g04569 protein n=1 Tax=Microbotryum silenes-dioicae TaxID=796604 RepID=A0A2X0MUI8_9BASI|nr:BQ5605_C007g04569 [Microbotryum silenes-dioicae]
MTSLVNASGLESFDHTHIWFRVPNESTRASPRPPATTEREPSSSPDRPHDASDRSPRSSVSSFTTATSSNVSPSHPPQATLPSYFQSHHIHTFDGLTTTWSSAATKPSSLTIAGSPPNSLGLTALPTSAISWAPSSAAVLGHRKPGTASNHDHDRDEGSDRRLTSLSTHDDLPGVPTAALLSPPIGSEPESEHTQAALAQIFGGHIRPHYRPIHPFLDSRAPLSSSLASPPRSYFSPPPLPSPGHPPGQSCSSSSAKPRSRSYSSASALSDIATVPKTLAALDGSFPEMNHSTNDAYGFQSSGSHFSTSLPVNPIRIGQTSPSLTSSSGGHDADEPAPSRPALGAFAGANSFSGGIGLGRGAQTGWRSSSATRASSFGWEDADREGRSRLRAESDGPWASEDTTSGIGLSNMSPFSRDGSRLLFEPQGETRGFGTGAGTYKARRDHSLGAVGSGRMRGDLVWGRSERTLNEAENEDDDSFVPPTKSGATSRRHSFATFNSSSRSQIGFHLPEEARSPPSQHNGGFGSMALGSNDGDRRFGPGSSAINDDDLAADLNSLHLNLEAHAAVIGGQTASSTSPRSPGGLGHVGSMPVNFPPMRSSRHFSDVESSRSPPVRSSGVASSTPAAVSSSSGDDSSRAMKAFFLPQPSVPTTSLSPSTAQRVTSRFEFGGTSPGKTASTTGPMHPFASGAPDLGLGAFRPPPTSQPTISQAPPQQRSGFMSGLMGQIPPPPPPPGGPASGYPGMYGQGASNFGNYGALPPPPPPSQMAMGPGGGIPQHPVQHGFGVPLPQSFYTGQGQGQGLAPRPRGGTPNNSGPPLSGAPQGTPNATGNTGTGNKESNGDLSNLGRGIPLHNVPANAPLYIVEFKAGRKDLFFVDDPNLQLRQGDLVIVEADRGKDIGKFFKPCSLDEVQAFQQRLVEIALGQLAHNGGGGGGGGMDPRGPGGAANTGGPPNAATLARMTKEFAPKRLFGKASASDTHQLLSKAQDEVKALALVRQKVAQRSQSHVQATEVIARRNTDPVFADAGLPMEVFDAEWQWDRRKLTFYYTANTRVDFRELVRELFRVYKTRVWMCCLDANSSEAWNFA